MKPSGCFFESRAKLPIICETTKYLHCYFVISRLSFFICHLGRPKSCTNHFPHFFYLCFVKLQRYNAKKEQAI